MKPLATSSAAWLSGFIADLPTPFSDSDEIDWTAFAGLCQRQIEAGATAIVVGETTGEAATLMPAEHDMLVRAAVKTARGRIKVIAGAGSNSTSQAIALTRRAEAAGAEVLAGPGCDRVADVAIERLAVRDQILELSGPRVAGAHKDEDAAGAAPGADEERLDGVAPEVGVDGEGIGIPNGVNFAVD